MTIPKRFEEVLEDAKLAEVDPDAAKSVGTERTMLGVDTPTTGIDAITPVTYNASNGLPVMAKNVHNVDRLEELVQEFGLTAGGSKLTTWEQPVKWAINCCR